MRARQGGFISWDTVFGILAGFGLFVFAVWTSTDNALVFWSVASLSMVIGGTFAATLISYQSAYVMKTIKALFGILIPTRVSAGSLFADVGRLLEWSRDVREKGPAILDDQLENAAANKLDKFTVHGLNMLSSGYKGEELRELLMELTETMFDRSQVQVGVLKTMAQFAPAFGMIGTLVGLVIMLDNLKADVSQLGQGLALALITTLYGVIAANLVFKPAALKTDQKNNVMRFRNTLLSEGFVMLSEKVDPLKMQDKLNSFLDPAVHFDLLATNEKGKKR
ncbi:MAG: MotA/TolQ/ExbB proton channel family protein [Gammaproteobacteria bacterium]|nr:MotA/TolQ/ExbB proton channel family protein [Gammaproteobacteria bacterium]